MELDKYLIGLIVFSVVVTFGVGMISDINNNYGLSLSTSEYTGNYSIIDDVYGISEDQKEDVLGGEFDSTDTSNSMFTGGFSAVRLVKRSFGLVYNILQAVANQLGIPAYFLLAANAAIFLLVTAAIIYLVFRFQNR